DGFSVRNLPSILSRLRSTDPGASSFGNAVGAGEIRGGGADPNAGPGHWCHRVGAFLFDFLPTQARLPFHRARVDRPEPVHAGVSPPVMERRLHAGRAVVRPLSLEPDGGFLDAAAG